MLGQESHAGTRLSTICTTGWTHWFHSELWLFQGGILRMPIGWLKSLCCVGYVAEWRNPYTRVFSAEEFSKLVSNPRNLWIPREALKSAILDHSYRGVVDLRVHLSDGRSFQLLTFLRKRIYQPLESALHEWLGEAFVITFPWWLG